MKKIYTHSWMILTVVFTFGIIFNSCEDHDTTLKEKQSSVTDPQFQYLINELGFNPKDVVDKGDYYLVEGDIMFNKASFNKQSLTGARTGQAITNELVSADNQGIITVYLHPILTSVWEYSNLVEGTKDAIAEWNNVSCSNIYITLIESDDNPDITIGIAGDRDIQPNDIPAVCDFPSGGKPGRFIRLNLHTIDELNKREDYKRFIMHGLGHTIGFRHTNWKAIGESKGSKGVNNIPGTSTTDSNSIMFYSFSDLHLSDYDKIALQNVYPGEGCPAPFYRYYSSSAKDHFYTTNFGDLGAGRYGMSIERIECHLYQFRSVTGLKPLYRYYSEGATDHFYTDNYNELGAGGWGFVYEGVSGYVYKNPATGRLALHRYYSASATDHFYTVTNSDLSSIGYAYEGIVGYVLP